MYFPHETVDVHPRFPALPLRDRILGEEITASVWHQDRFGEWWRVVCYEGGWKEWTPLQLIENMFDENRQLSWYEKAAVYRNFC